MDDCKLVVQSEAMAAAFNEAWRKRYRDPPDAEAAARDVLGLKYVRTSDEEGESVTISCGKALDDLEKKLGNLNPGGGNRGSLHRAAPAGSAARARARTRTHECADARLRPPPAPAASWDSGARSFATRAPWPC